uniref:Uncharacterized protein n=1 Tax=Solanum lycopersicum TaxID=4081 RepID=A0A3Q7F866_SOLLC
MEEVMKARLERAKMLDYPEAISPPFEPYDPRYAAMGLPLDPYLRAFKLNPNLGFVAGIIRHLE